MSPKQAMEMALDCLLYYNRREAYPRPESPTNKTINALRAALAEPMLPVALDSVELQRDTHGMCTVLVNGRVAIKEYGDVISHYATPDWFAGEPSPSTASEMLRQECDDSDALLRLIGLDQQQHRTEGGSLNLPKIRDALAEREAGEPYAYLVEQEQGYIVGAWKDRETAEKIAAQQLARDKERVVEVYDRPAPARELSDDELLKLWTASLVAADKAMPSAGASAHIVSALRAVLRAAGSSDEDRKDAERFRWMDEHVHSADTVSNPDNLVEIWYGPAELRASGRTLREAVDNAMRAAGGAR